jgi:hypothetical protein
MLRLINGDLVLGVHVHMLVGWVGVDTPCLLVVGLSLGHTVQWYCWLHSLLEGEHMLGIHVYVVGLMLPSL